MSDETHSLAEDGNPHQPSTMFWAVQPQLAFPSGDSSDPSDRGLAVDLRVSSDADGLTKTYAVVAQGAEEPLGVITTGADGTAVITGFGGTASEQGTFGIFPQPDDGDRASLIARTDNGALYTLSTPVGLFTQDHATTDAGVTDTQYQPDTAATFGESSAAHFVEPIDGIERN